MAKTKPPKLNAAERLLVSKRKLIKRLRADIADVREDADAAVSKIERRIYIAQAIAEALENGTLKL